jgi:hypothetical protein
LRETSEVTCRESFANPQQPDETKDALPAPLEWAWRIAKKMAIELELILPMKASSDAGHDTTSAQLSL